jgi:glutaredoxin-like YruB-family protein
MKSINTQAELTECIKEHNHFAILFYKAGSANSDCAYHALSGLTSVDEVPLYFVNVAEAEPVHQSFGITSAPTLVILNQGSPEQLIKGCHQPEVLAKLLKKSSVTTSSGTTVPQVTVYSTPSCPHCTSLKNYLKQLQVPFRDINVAADQQKAQELVQRTGQQGVPQAQINGQWVLGFDKAKIDQLLK